MTYVERSDEQLLELSRQGLASAFCVLVHRYGPTILHDARKDDDPVGATTATFLRAMRTLPDTDGQDVQGWLLDLAADELGVDRGTLDTEVPEPVGAAPTTGSGSRTAPITIDPRLDEVWAELAPRWPSGTRRRHVPSWAIWLGTILVLMALAILLPWAVLGSLGNDDPVIPEVRAAALLEDRESEEEPADDEVVEEEPLPTFEFPEPPSDDGSEPDPVPDPEPEPDPAPAPGPTDNAPAETASEDDPAPSGSGPDDQPADGGSTDDGATDDAPDDDPPPALDPGDDATDGDATQPAATDGENP